MWEIIMPRTRMSWDWVGAYPMFIYTRFIDHGVFEVKIVKGVKNNQNAGNKGPKAPGLKYTSKGIISKKDVVTDALRKARKLLKLRKICGK